MVDIDELKKKKKPTKPEDLYGLFFFFLFAFLSVQRDTCKRKARMILNDELA